MSEQPDGVPGAGPGNAGPAVHYVYDSDSCRAEDGDQGDQVAEEPGKTT